LDASKSEQRKESIFPKPGFVALRLETAEDIFRFSTANRFVQRNKQVRRPQVAVVFRNFVFQNQMRSKSIPGQFRDQAMILVQVVSVMSEDQVGRNFLL